MKLQVHEIVTIQFIDFEIGQLYEKDIERSYESDSIVVGSYTDEAGNEHSVYGTVKATANIHEQEIRAKGLLELTIIDFQSNEIITSKKYPGEYVWEHKWATYNGDSKALPKSVLSLTGIKQEMPPSPQDMFLLLSDPMYHNTTSYLKAYYKNK